MAQRPFLRLLSFFFILLFMLSSSLQAKYDPAFEWHTLETENFLFHYHDGLESVALEFAEMGEVIHEEITDFFSWYPANKTHVVLSDHSDSPNGSARFYPNNRIKIYLTPPSEIGGLEDYQNWKYLVFKHEYVHIVQLDMAKDFPLHMRSLLGRHRFLFPNRFLPKWITEGIATYIETDTKIGIGRGQSSYYRALMRNEVEKGVRSLYKTNHSQSDWPGQTTRYLYGVYFFHFLEQEYGKELIQEFMNDYSQFPIPFFINTVFKGVYKKTLYDLWDEFNIYLQEEFKPELTHPRKLAIDVKQLSTSGFNSGFSRIIDEKTILYIQNNRKDIKSLVKLNLEGHSKINLFQSNTMGSSFDFHATKGILLPISDWVNNSRLVSDLYTINIETGDKHRLTYDKRYIRAIWHPYKNQIIAVKTQKGQHRLDLLDLNGKFLKTLWGNEKDVVIGAISHSPTEESIVASVLRPTTGWNLETFNTVTLKWTAITRNNFIEAHPQFSKNGDDIIYSADYTKIYNIYQLNMKDKSLYQLTDVNNAALSPEVDSRSNTLFYSGLTSNGFNLHSQKNQTTLLKSNFKLFDLPHNKQLSKINTQTKPATEIHHKISQYNAIKYLTPSWWEPAITTNSNGNQLALGLFVGTQDPIARHNYSMFFAFDIKNRIPMWNTFYQFSRYAPLMSFRTKQSNYYPNTVTMRQEREASLSINWPISHVNNHWNFIITAKRLYTGFYLQNEPDALTNATNDDLINTGVTRSTTSYPPLAVTQHSGYQVSLAYELNNTIESLKSHSKIIFDAAIFSPIIKNTVIELGSTIISGGSKAGDLFLSHNLNPSMVRNSPGKRTYGLEGYITGQFKGSNLQRLYINLHLPIINPQRTIMSPPIGVGKIKLKTFFQAARIENYHQINSTSWSRSIGAELSARINLGYSFISYTLTAGIAKGLDQFGEFIPQIRYEAQF